VRLIPEFLIFYLPSTTLGFGFGLAAGILALKRVHFPLVVIGVVLEMFALGVSILGLFGPIVLPLLGLIFICVRKREFG